MREAEATAKAEKATATARSHEITALCAKAKQDGLAETFISGGRDRSMNLTGRWTAAAEAFFWKPSKAL